MPRQHILAVPFVTSPGIIRSEILPPVDVSKTIEWVANSVEPDQTPHSDA